MDLTNLVTQDNSENGKWFQVELYGEKQDFFINILGDDSDKVQKFQRKQFKKINGSKKGKNEVDDELIDEILDNQDEAVLVRMNGIKGMKEDDEVILCGETLKNDVKSYSFLISKIPAIKDFILTKSKDRLNFLSDRKKS